MMTLPPLEILHPDSVADAVTMLRDRPGAKLLAGGTDIVPNLKYGMYETTALVALRGLSRELRYIREEDGELRLGALCTIDQVARDEKVLTRFPALAEAAAAIAGPQLRRMGTLGGNLCLDTRCVYINQSHFWRKALGYCLKKDGTVCHVVKGGQRCVAAASNDTAPILMALGASVRLASPRGERTLSLEDLYVADQLAAPLRFSPRREARDGPPRRGVERPQRRHCRGDQGGRRRAWKARAEAVQAVNQYRHRSRMAPRHHAGADPARRSEGACRLVRIGKRGTDG
jgi:4-hydroxybenzoyl-CoA reductase beta subunit